MQTANMLLINIMAWCIYGCEEIKMCAGNIFLKCIWQTMPKRCLSQRKECVFAAWLSLQCKLSKVWPKTMKRTFISKVNKAIMGGIDQLTILMRDGGYTPRKPPYLLKQGQWTLRRYKQRQKVVLSSIPDNRSQHLQAYDSWVLWCGGPGMLMIRCELGNWSGNDCNLLELNVTWKYVLFVLFVNFPICYL